jgi:hypothetical protein
LVKGPCTGIVANTAPATTPPTFPVTATGKAPAAAGFIFVTEDGVLSAWASGADATQAFVQMDNSANAVYKGLALVTTPVVQLYAANFKSGGIDVFDAQFKPVTLAAGSFTDAKIPAGFAPFNIWNIGGKLYVAYAKQDAAKKFDVGGPGNGYVDVFDTTGKLLQSLVVGGTNSALNSPWGLAIAPATFGKFANDLLVGNFGDGTINAYDPTTGARRVRGNAAGRQRQEYRHQRPVGSVFRQWRQRRRQGYAVFHGRPRRAEARSDRQHLGQSQHHQRRRHQCRAAYSRDSRQHLRHHQGHQPGGDQADLGGGGFRFHGQGATDRA